MDKPHVKLEFQEPDPKPSNTAQLPAILGLIKSQAEEPTGKPRSFYEQFRIVDGVLWFYDTRANTWQPAGAVEFGVPPQLTYDPTTYGAPALVFGEGGNAADFLLVYRGAGDFRILPQTFFDAFATFTAPAEFTFGLSARDITLFPNIHIPAGLFSKTSMASVDTTGATPTQLTVAGVIPTSGSVMVEVHVLARRTGGSSGSSGDSAAYVRRGVFENHSSFSYNIVGSIQDDFTEESQPAWDCTLDIDTAPGDQNKIRVMVTGAANNDITWSATIKVVSFTP